MCTLLAATLTRPFRRPRTYGIVALMDRTEYRERLLDLVADVQGNSSGAHALRGLLEDAADTAIHHPRRSGVAHIWEDFRRPLRKWIQETDMLANRKVIRRALVLLDIWHPEDLREHEKTRAHHKTIGAQRLEDWNAHRPLTPHTPRDPMRAYLNSVVEDGRPFGDPPLWRQADKAGFVRRSQGRTIVTAAGRAYLRGEEKHGV